MNTNGLDAGELDRIVKKLNDAKAISEWHFRDAAEELLMECWPHEPWEY